VIPFTVKLDEENLTHAGLAQENVVGPARIQNHFVLDTNVFQPHP
jgi:hypothetical protein